MMTLYKLKHPAEVKGDGTFQQLELNMLLANLRAYLAVIHQTELQLTLEKQLTIRDIQKALSKIKDEKNLYLQIDFGGELFHFGSGDVAVADTITPFFIQSNEEALADSVNTETGDFQFITAPTVLSPDQVKQLYQSDVNSQDADIGGETQSFTGAETNAAYQRHVEESHGVVIERAVVGNPVEQDLEKMYRDMFMQHIKEQCMIHGLDFKDYVKACDSDSESDQLTKLPVTKLPGLDFHIDSQSKEKATKIVSKLALKYLSNSSIDGKLIQRETLGATSQAASTSERLSATAITQPVASQTMSMGAAQSQESRDKDQVRQVVARQAKKHIAEQKIRELKETISQLEESLSNAQADADAQRQLAARSGLESEEYRGRLELSELERAQQSETIKKQRQEIGSQAKKLAEAREENRAQTEAVTTLQEQVQASEKQLQIYKGEGKKDREAIADLKKKLEKSKTSQQGTASANDELTIKLSAEKRRSKRFESQLNARDKEINSLNQQIQVSRRNQRSMASSLAESRRQSQEQSKTIAALQQKIEQLRASSLKLQSSHEQQFQEAQALTGQQSETIRTLKERNAALTGELRTKDRKIGELEHKNSTLEHELGQDLTKVQDLQQKLCEMGRDRHQLVTNLDDAHQQKIQKLKGKLEQKIQELKGKLEDSSQQVNKLKGELEQAKKGLNVARAAGAVRGFADGMHKHQEMTAEQNKLTPGNRGASWRQLGRKTSSKPGGSKLSYEDREGYLSRLRR